jgi:hypothetical protein
MILRHIASVRGAIERRDPSRPAGSECLVNVIREKLAALADEVGRAQNEQAARAEKIAA